MDTEQLVAHSRARFEHAVARRTLKEKYQARMIFAYGGGMWQAGPELLSVLNCCTRTNKTGCRTLARTNECLVGGTCGT